MAPQYTPVDYDPFAQDPRPGDSYTLTPVDGDPFADPARPGFLSTLGRALQFQVGSTFGMQALDRSTGGVGTDLVTLGAGGAVTGTGRAIEGVERLANEHVREAEDAVGFLAGIGRAMGLGGPAGAMALHGATRDQPLPSDQPAYQPSALSGALKDTGERMSSAVTPAMRAAMEGTQIGGDAFDPSTWTLGRDPSARGLLGHIAKTGGEMAPIVGAGFVNPALAIGTAAGQSASGAYEENADYFLKLPPSELAQVPRFRELVERGLEPSRARAIVADEAGRASMTPAAVVGAGSGVILSGAATGPLARAMAARFGDKFATRLAANALEMPLEGAQEVAESASGRHGANTATGADRSLTEDTFGDFVLGAAAAGPAAAVHSVTGSIDAEHVDGERAPRTFTPVDHNPFATTDAADVDTRRAAVANIMGRAGQNDDAADDVAPPDPARFEPAAVGSLPEVDADAPVAGKPKADWRADLEAITDDVAPEPVRQSMRARYEAAERAKPIYDQALTDIASALGLEAPMLAPIKGIARAVEKTMGDNEGDATRLNDIVRGTLVVTSPEQAAAAVRAVKDRFGDVVVKGDGLSSRDAPERNAAGYRDINIVAKVDGVPVEIQVNVPRMLEAKEAAHPLYERWRAIDAKVRREGRKATPDEAEEMRLLTERQREIYAAAWTDVLGGKPAADSAASRASGSPSAQVLSTVRPHGVSRLTGQDLPPSNAMAVNSGEVPNGSHASSPTSMSPNHSVPGGSERGSTLRGSSAMGTTSTGIVPQEDASEWTAFPSESGTLGVPRAEMPQIKRKDRDNFIRFLESKGIKSTKSTAPAGWLKPTQAEYSQPKVDKFADGGPVDSREVMVSSDGHVLDGHHQWMAHQKLGTDVPVIRLDAPIRTLLDAANAFPSTQRSNGATSAPAPAAPAPRPNLVLRRPGRVGTAYTASNDPVDFQYAIVEADELTASNAPDGSVNPNFPSELQPRDRTTPESRAQVQSIAGNLQPERLGESGDIVNGAPLVGPDGIVESGNGRVMALASAPAERKAAYRKWLADSAEQFGLGRAATDGMRDPVLVRVRRGDLDMEGRARLGREGNRGTQQAMNPVEVARSDAQIITDDMMDLFAPSEDGDVLAASNQQFLQAFAKAIGGMETAGLSQDGAWTRQMRDRVEAAVFSRAYGDDRLLQAFAADADPDMKNILAALGTGAREFAIARSNGAAEAGLDAGALFADAVSFIRAARGRGMTVATMLDQGSLFGDTPPVDTSRVALWLSTNARAHRQLGTALVNIGRAIRAELDGRKTVDVFGKPDRKLGDIVNEQIGEFEQRQRPAGQSGLFTAGGRARPQGGVSEPGDRAGAGADADARGNDNPPRGGESPRDRGGEQPTEGLSDERDQGRSGDDRAERSAEAPGQDRGAGRDVRRRYDDAPGPDADTDADGAEPDGVAELNDQRSAFPGIAERRRNPGQLDILFPPNDGAVAAEKAVKREAPKFSTRTALVETGRFFTGITKIASWQDAAHLIAPLRKSPQEQMLAVVVGADGKALSVIRHTIGVADGASVEPWSLVGAIAAVPGARQVYFAHNHPSGRLDQSAADRAITTRLHDLLNGSGIMPRGMIVVAPGQTRATYYSPHIVEANGSNPADVPAARRTSSVPQQERAFRHRSEPTDTITDPTDAIGIVKDVVKGGRRSGIVLLNTRNGVVGILDVAPAEMTELRTGDPATGTARILRAVEQANASAAIPFGEYRAVRNVGRMLSDASVRVIDAVEIKADGTIDSASRNGVSVASSEPFLSRRRSAATLDDQEVHEIAVRVLGVNAVDRNVVIAPFGALPAEVQKEAEEQGATPDEVRGVHWKGRTYLVSGRFGSAAEVAETLYHEHYVHGGLRAKYGDRLGMELSIMLARTGGLKGVLKLAREQGIDLGAYVDGIIGNPKIPERHQKLVIMEELLAHVGESTGTLRRTIEEWVGLLREFLRKHGFVELADYGVTDLARVLREARQAAQAVDAHGRSDAPGFHLAVTDTYGSPMFSIMPAHVSDGARDALSKVGAKVNTAPLKQRFAALRDRWQDRFTQGVFDQFRSLAKLDPIAFMQAHLSRGTDGALEAMFLHGTPKITDGAFDIDPDGEGFRGVLAGLEGEHDLFIAWVAGNRAEKLAAEGRENLFTDFDIAALKKLNHGTLPSGKLRAVAYAEAHEKMKRYQKAVLDIAEQAGMIDPDGRKTWESEFYVPFYRVLEDQTDGIKVSSGQAGLVRQRAIRQLKGGKEQLGDLLENTLSNWSNLLAGSMKNMAASRALRAGVTAGIATPVAAAEKGSVWVMDGGKQRHYLVDDPLVLESLTALDFAGFNNMAMRAMGKMKRVLTVAVTISPTFRVRNLIRDTLSATGVSPVSANPLRNLVNGWSMTSQGSAGDIALLAGGGKIRFGTLNDGSQARNAKRLIERGVKGADILDSPAKVRAALRAVWDWYQETGDRAETVNRGAIYKQLRDQGMSHLEASYEARDLMNFTSMGSFAAVRALTQVVPFMNARLQGLYKLGRGARANPLRFSTVTGIIGLASALLYLMQADDDDYKDLPDWVRDTYWPIKLPTGHWVYIPKPFEIGALGSVVERGTELAFGGSDYEAKDFRRTLASIIANQLSMNPTPQAIKPAVEAFFNYDTFRDRPIDSVAQERLDPERRFSARTSAGARVVGDALNVSPNKVEHLVRGYFGWIGTQALNASDWLLRDAMDMPANPARDTSSISNLFVIGDFIKHPDDVPSKYVERFYEAQRKIDQIYATAQDAIKLGETEYAAEKLAEPDLELRALYKSTGKQIDEVNKHIRQVSSDPTLTAAEKNEQLRYLNDLRNDIARGVDEQARAARAAR